MPLEKPTDILPLAEETLRVEKRTVSRGGKRIRSITDHVEEVVRSDLATEEIEVDRVPIGKEVASVPPVRTEGDVTIIPVLEEVVHVEKRLVLVEEIHVRRTSRVQQKSAPVTLRKQRVVIEDVAPGKSPSKNASSQPTHDEDD
jgi:uncharacterized protein (TIGR02271 family)